MSKWTHVSGAVKVNTLSRSSAEALYLTQTAVNHLPRISGSERDVEYYINLVNGYNASANCDEFDCHSNLGNGWTGRRLFEWQTCALITLYGALRDRTFEQTLRETTKALHRLSSRLFVDECIVSVRDDDRSFWFDNPKWIMDMDRSDLCRKLLWGFDE